MDKINFQNLPSTNTPINASNLNQMQNNTEKAINDLIKTTVNVMPANSKTKTVNIPGLKTVINVYAHDTTITTYPNREIIGFKQEEENVTVTQAGTLQYDNYFTIVYI